MYAHLSSKIENLYDIHRLEGFGGIVRFWHLHIKNVLKKYPVKPFPSDTDAREELDFVNTFASAQDKNFMTPFDKVAKNWLDSGYCDICFSNLLQEYAYYLDSEGTICLSAKDIVEAFDYFEECRHLDLQGKHYQKWELQEGIFELVDEKFKVAEALMHETPTFRSYKNTKSTHYDPNRGLILDVITEIMRKSGGK